MTCPSCGSRHLDTSYAMWLDRNKTRTLAQCRKCGHVWQWRAGPDEQPAPTAPGPD